MKQAYFEAGRIVSGSLRFFLLASIVLIVFLLDDDKGVLLVPFISLKLNYKYALGFMFFLQACFFYRFIAAVNYERALRSRVREKCESSAEDAWLITYPSIFNFHQFNGSMIDTNRPKVFKVVAISLLMFFGLFLPIWVVVQSFLLGFDIKLLSVVVISCLLIILTFIGLIEPADSKDNKSSKKDAQNSRASS